MSATACNYYTRGYNNDGLNMKEWNERIINPVMLYFLLNFNFNFNVSLNNLQITLERNNSGRDKDCYRITIFR